MHHNGFQAREKRVQIMDIAAALFYERGIERIAISALTTSASMPRGAF